MLDTGASAHTVMKRCDILGSYSEEQDRLTRHFATSVMRQANDAVIGWMRTAGMAVRQDQVGNIIGRYEADTAKAKTLLLGSHLDTVCDAGKYDGPLGVLTALACVERLYQQQRRLPFAIEILAFADEEGLRYRSTYLGSQVFAGTFDPHELRLTDVDGITMAEAIRAFGGDPDRLHEARRQKDDLLGYCELHIEQGPQLEALNLPVGVVSSIAGQNRLTVSFLGEAGHAGTVPMHLRHDALCAAAEFILVVEKLAQSEQGLVATIGQIAVQPGASNVIPGKTTLSLDVRHQDDHLRIWACQQLEEQARRVSSTRHISLDWQLLQEKASVDCTPRLMRFLARAIEQTGYPVHTLASGAGHDAVIMASLTDIAMLFVRCKDGISHHPAEAVDVQDVEVAIQVLEQFLALLAQEQG